MEKLNDFSIRLENLLRNNNYISDDRDDLLYFMFCGNPLEDKINKLCSEQDFDDYFFIGKIIFLEKWSFKQNEDKNKKIKELLKNKNYLILNDDFKIEDLESFIIRKNEEETAAENKETQAVNIKNNELNKQINSNIQDKWSTTLKDIKELNITLKTKPKSKYFNFDNITTNQVKLSEVITDEFERMAKQIHDAKSSKYQSNKLENALFLAELTNIFQSRTDLYKLIDISKDKISDFKIISLHSNKDLNWDDMQWKDIKNIKE